MYIVRYLGQLEGDEDVTSERPFLSNQDTYLYTRGQALYLYTHNAGALGFGGGYAYRERPTGNNQNLYTVTVSGATFAETTAERKQYPSHWASTHAATGLSVTQRKFVTYNNVAVTLLTLTNTGAEATTRTVTAGSPIATVPGNDELTGTVSARYDITVITPRLSGEGLAVSGTVLSRSVSLEPGASVTLKVQLGTTTAELPESSAEYDRYRAYDAETAFRTHLKEYNRWWVENVPYIDVPDANIKKMSYYRTFLNRYNHIDAIQLTQPMHLQDLKYFRDPLYSYGNWVSSGETSKCTAFTSNPGSFSWGNTYEQYIAREAFNAYKVHGGDRGVLANFAHYAECDIKGQLAKYDRGNANSLIEYNSGALTGNDADAVALQYYPSQISQDRTETAFWYSGARAAADAYSLLGDAAKAAEMNAIADTIRASILTNLWDSTPADSVPTPVPATRTTGRTGNAVGLNGSHPNTAVTLPSGVVSGPVTVAPGAGLISNGATIIGPISASGARTVQLLGGQVLGPVTIDRAYGRVAVAGTEIVGPVRLSGNTTGVTSIDVMANTVVGPLTCSANNPAPVDNGLPNTVIGPSTCRFS